MFSKYLNRYVVFSIDYDDNGTVRQFFENHFKSYATDNLVKLIGMYDGKKENSYLCNERDFKDVVYKSRFIKNQECVMFVTACNKQYTTLVFLEDNKEVYLGCLKDVSEEIAMQSDAWSYRPDMDKYWVTVNNNPDHVRN